MSASTGTLDISREHGSRAWLAMGAVLIAVAIGAAVTLAGSDGSRTTGRAVTATRGAELTQIEQLVNSGVVPREALQPRLGEIERLVNSGVVPSETQQPRIEPLYSSEDLAMLTAVAGGSIPAETLDQDHFLILRLINQGMIPREAANG